MVKNNKAAYWIKQLDEEEEKHKSFRKNAHDTFKTYSTRDCRDTEVSKKPALNILDRVVECQMGAVFTSIPRPVISKRFQQEGKRQSDDKLAQVLERQVKYVLDQNSFYSRLRLAVLDFRIADLGVIFLRYDDDEETIQAQQETELGIEIIEKTIPVNQSIYPEVIAPKSFRWQPSKSWDDCDWIAVSHELTSAEFKSQFPDSDMSKVEPVGMAGKKFRVYEIWSKSKEQVIYISKGSDKILKSDHELYEFFDGYPTPEPMWLNISSDKLIPSPEYLSYKEQADDLNSIIKERKAIRKSIKDIVIGDKSAFADFQKVFKSSKHGHFIPLDLTKYAMQGGTPNINNLLTFPDYTSKINLLGLLAQEKKDLQDDIYQQSGIFDLMQGVSTASETATAQDIKEGHGNLRISQQRNCVANYMRAIIEKTVDIIVNNFTLSNLKNNTGVELNNQVDPYSTISDFLPEGMIGYLIDIETGSTIARDKRGEQRQIGEAIQTITGSLSALQPLVQSNFITMEFMQGLFSAVTKGFPQLRNLDDEISGLSNNWDTNKKTQEQIQQMQQESQGLQQQIQQLTEQNRALAAENLKNSEASNAVKMADAEKKMAEAEETKVDTAQKANEMLVDPYAIVDEQQAIGMTQQQVSY